MNYTSKYPIKKLSQDEINKLNKFRKLCGQFEDTVNIQLQKQYQRIVNSEEYKTLQTKKDRKRFWYKKEFEITFPIIDKNNTLTSETMKVCFGKKPGQSMSIAQLTSKMAKTLIDGRISFTNKGINSIIAKLIGERMYSAWEKKIFHNGKKISFNDNEGVKSIPFGKTNGFIIGITINWDKDLLSFIIKTDNTKKQTITIFLDPKRLSERDYKTLELAKDPNNITGIRLCHDMVRGKDNYKIEIAYRNIYIPPKNNPIGNMSMGIDPGPTYTYTYTTDNKNTATANVYDLRPFENNKEQKRIEAKLADIERKMERSRRTNNPDNYKEDGTCKSRKHIKAWKDSKHYLKLKEEKAELMRKYTAKRDIKHHILSKELLSKANVITIEKNDIKSMSERNKGIKLNKNGKIKSNKKYGKSISNAAPSGFLSKLKAKASLRGVQIKEIEAINAATQFDPILGNKSEKHVDKFDKTHTTSDGFVHDRNILAAFNICHNVSDNLTVDEIKTYKDNNQWDKLYNLKEMKKDYKNLCNIECKQ